MSQSSKLSLSFTFPHRVPLYCTNPEKMLTSTDFISVPLTFYANRKINAPSTHITRSVELNNWPSMLSCSRHFNDDVSDSLLVFLIVYKKFPLLTAIFHNLPKFQSRLCPYVSLVIAWQLTTFY
jgi:hypothetical protein